MRRLEGTSDATKLVVTVAVLVATVGIMQTIWDPTVFRTTHELFGNKFTIANIDIPYNDVTVLVLAALVAIGLRLLLYNTRLGVAMRATVDDRSLAVMNGANPNRASQASWIIGTQLASLAGILVAPEAEPVSSSADPADRQRVCRGDDRTAAQPAHDVRRSADPRPRQRPRRRLPPEDQDRPAVHQRYWRRHPGHRAAARGPAAQADQAARKHQAAHQRDQPDPDLGRQPDLRRDRHRGGPCCHPDPVAG